MAELLPVRLDIEGGLHGRFEVPKNQDFLAGEESNNNLPFGRITVEFETDSSGLLIPTLDTSPREICLYINALSPGQVEQFRAEMIIGEKKFEGQRVYDGDDTESKQGGDIMFLSWRESGKRGAVDASYFPHDPSIFDRIQFIISKD